MSRKTNGKTTPAKRRRATKPNQNRLLTAAERLKAFLDKHNIGIWPQPVWYQSQDTGCWSLRINIVVDYQDQQKEQQNG